MIQLLRTRPLLAAAIAAALAVTAAPAAAVPRALPDGASSAPNAWDATRPLSSPSARNVLPYPSGSEVLSAGPNGFLSVNAKDEVRWTRYADGAATLVSRDASQFRQTEWHGALSDVVAVGEGGLPANYRSVRLIDMSTGTDRAVIDLGPTSDQYWYAGTVESTVIATRTRSADAQDLHLLTRTDGQTQNRKVVGLPDNAHRITTAGAAPGGLLVEFRAGTPENRTMHLAVVDLATATVTAVYPNGTDSVAEESALSATRLAWIDVDVAAQRTTLSVAVHGSDTEPPLQWELPAVDDPVVGLVGDWVAYGNATPVDRGTAGDPLLPLTVRPVTGGAPRTLLDHVSSLTPAPDGSLLAVGGTLDQGEGVYRISAYGSNAPVVQLIASTGEPTKVTYLGDAIPRTVDLDRNRGQVPLQWRLSRLNVRMTVTLRHVRTGATLTRQIRPDQGDTGGPQSAQLVWDGLLDASGGGKSAAYNGDYTWHISATPVNGIGPDVTASGQFTVVRRPAPHDYTDNGSPDVLARDTAGRLWREDTHFDLATQKLGRTTRQLIGGGWNVYDVIEAVGDAGGTTAGDVVARDRAGVLWLYQGRTDGSFAPRVRVSGGWQIHRQIAGGGDFTGDGRADLVAVDTAGVLWLYRGTGKASAPYAARQRVGGGWQPYVQLTSVGQVAGSSAGDLVVRDSAGVLWLYQGRGNGGFLPRVKVGGGWKPYTHLVGIGDGNRDGRADLHAFGPNSASFFYESTGDAKVPFRPRSATPVLTDQSGTYDRIS
ncbi:VCBS repeat-containing protein [Streptomyces sp. NPDC005963]|uniref:VCBS repeat-containing protein n=1 Tax=Streptomyces sp. NPDC005963 TaxID=3156721 RepID=UPI0033F24E48